MAELQALQKQRSDNDQQNKEKRSKMKNKKYEDKEALRLGHLPDYPQNQSELNNSAYISNTEPNVSHQKLTSAHTAPHTTLNAGNEHSHKKNNSSKHNKQGQEKNSGNNNSTGSEADKKDTPGFLSYLYIVNFFYLIYSVFCLAIALYVVFTLGQKVNWFLLLLGILGLHGCISTFQAIRTNEKSTVNIVTAVILCVLCLATLSFETFQTKSFEKFITPHKSNYQAFLGVGFVLQLITGALGSNFEFLESLRS